MTTPLDRRTMLRGLGAAVSLPWLEAMAPDGFALAGSRALGAMRDRGIAGAATAPVSATGAPRRMAFCFIPNGVDPDAWIPRGGDGRSGRDGRGVGGDPPIGDLPPSLAPLQPLRDRFSVLTGLSHRNARALGNGPGDHARSSACFLTGVHPVKTAGTDIEAGVSVDQVAAKRIGDRTSLASLEIGCEPALQSGDCDSGYSCAYSANISWRAPHLPNLKEIRPRAIFERLFSLGPDGESKGARARRLATRRSILDHVSTDAQRLNRRLGADDRRRMDEYLDGVRSLERRIDEAERATGDPDAVAGFDMPNGTPRDYREHLELMNRMLVLALQLDRTRIATYMLANEGSNRPFPFLDVAEGHHHLSHHGGDASMIEKIRRINHFQSEMLADLLQRMDAVQEGEGTLLDNTMLVFGAAIRDGNRHDHDDLPVILAGGGAGTLTPGRHVAYDSGTPMCNLYVSMLERMGVDVPRFGDSTGPLGRL